MTQEALKLALEFVESINLGSRSASVEQQRQVITAIKEALAQPEQESVAYPDGDVVGPCICGSWPGGKCLKCPRITTPPQRTWVGLTEQEHTDIAVECGCMSADWVFYGAAVERKLKERNT